MNGSRFIQNSNLTNQIGERAKKNRMVNFCPRLIITLFLVNLFLPCSYGQQRSCGSPQLQQKLNTNPIYQRKHLARIKNFQIVNNKTRRNAANCTDTLLLPVAIHFQDISNPDIACLRDLSQDQIDILNHDLQGTNADLSNWTSNAIFYPGVNTGGVCVKFVLANLNHPSGFNLIDGDPAVTINVTTGDFINHWDNYINIVVRDIGDLGYAPLGGLGDGDGITIDDNAFGSYGCGQVIPLYPYNLGRTLVHEMGHYLYLNHIWANSNDIGGCTNDDEVGDTPLSTEPNYGCPSQNTSCGSIDLHMNYMDYVNDACMYMFTEGQAQRMYDWIQVNLQNVSNNASSVYTEACTTCTAPACVDADADGYCKKVDCNDNNSSIPAASGTACNDNNPATQNDIIQADGCTCSGVLNPCIIQGGDADADGVCDDLDCDPTDACFPKPVGTPCDDGNTLTVNDIIQSDGCSCSGTITVQAKLYPEGLYDSTNQQLYMELNTQNLIPKSQPFNTAPWNYGGTESVTVIPPNVVDWILIMVRTSDNTVISQAAGFLTTNGMIVDITGHDGIAIPNALNQYISIHHRNHLATITNNPYNGVIDLTTNLAAVQGIEQLKNIGGNYCLYAGDYDGNGIINNQDYNNWILKSAQLGAYLSVDGDANGVVNNLDYNLWVGNGSKIGAQSIQY